mmetsp:Transcript_19620/g.48912  ORF Transcript_19620/g.48912 Transcript_19620/m.48912 type:complete len:242 (+) Transcript_19620:300-1025(+)
MLSAALGYVGIQLGKHGLQRSKPILGLSKRRETIHANVLYPDVLRLHLDFRDFCTTPAPFTPKHASRFSRGSDTFQASPSLHRVHSRYCPSLPPGTAAMRSSFPSTTIVRITAMSAPEASRAESVTARTSPAGREARRVTSPSMRPWWKSAPPAAKTASGSVSVGPSRAIPAAFEKPKPCWRACARGDAMKPSWNDTNTDRLSNISPVCTAIAFVPSARANHRGLVHPRLLPSNRLRLPFQ